MGKYYLISVQYANDGTNPCAIFVYDTREKALGAHYSTLASNYNNKNLTGFLCMVIDENGMVIRKEDYKEESIDGN